MDYNLQEIIKIGEMILKNPNNKEFSYFQLCVNEIRGIVINKLKNDKEKKPICEECIYKYFIQERMVDIYEGFLRLIVEFFDFTHDNLRRSNNTFLALRVVKSFYKFMNTISDTQTRNKILLFRPLDINIFVNFFIKLNFLIFFFLEISS